MDSTQYGPGLMIKSYKTADSSAAKRTKEEQILDKLGDLGIQYEALKEAEDIKGLLKLAEQYKKIRRGEHMADRILRDVERMRTISKQERT